MRLDAGFWAGGAEIRATGLRLSARSLAESVLPSPQSVAGQWSLWSRIAGDFVLSGTAFVATSRLQAHSSTLLPISPENLRAWTAGDVRACLGSGLVYGALITLLGHSEGLYSDTEASVQEEGTLLAKAVGWATLVMACALWISGAVTSVIALGWTALISLLSLVGWRGWRRSVAIRKAAAGKGVRNVLIIGAGSQGRQLAEYFRTTPQIACVVKGLLDDHASGSDVIGGLEDLPHIARAEFIDEVILTIPKDRDAARRAIQLARQNRLDLKMVPELFGCKPLHSRMERLGEVPVISLHRESLPAVGLMLKRVMDVFLSSSAILLLSPLMAAIALLVKLDSPGPVLYYAPRVGRKGRHFRCYKFRSMVGDADVLKDKLRSLNQREGPCFKISVDPRITRVGRFLRRYSLDELPQLWNVLKGDMSLVGPRPHPLDDFARYELDHLRRLDMTPGITGLWQVTARRNPSFQTNLALDLEYIEQWSLWLDLRILFKTFSIVVAGSGV